LQGEERVAADLFRQLLRQSVRAGLFEAMSEEVEALCGPRYRPDSQSPCHRAGSETGVAYFDGGKEEIRRPRVRHETAGEVRLATYQAASSTMGLFDQIVASEAQGLPVRGVERAVDKAVSKSTPHQGCGLRKAANSLSCYASVRSPTRTGSECSSTGCG
jgi:putative transposase